MRRTLVLLCSTAHLPAAERNHIENLIRCARIVDQRLVIDHPILSIEAYQYGFSVHLGVLDDHPDRPEEVTPELWALLLRARTMGANWLSFDRDEPPSVDYPLFDDCENEHGAREPEHQPGAAEPAAQSPAPIAIHCKICGSSHVMRDAWAEWDENAQAWMLGSVFDAAFCIACEADTTLAEKPLVATEVAP